MGCKLIYSLSITSWVGRTHETSLQDSLCSFCLFELKVCRVVELSIPNICMIFGLNSFKWENDIARLTAELIECELT